MAKRLNILTHVQQAEGMKALDRRCPQPGALAWISVPKPQPKEAVKPRVVISVGAPDRPDPPHPVRIVLVA
jgi:hypothetical protein